MKLAEPGCSWKVVIQGRKAPSKPALLRGCLMSMESDRQLGHPKKIPQEDSKTQDLSPSAP